MVDDYFGVMHELENIQRSEKKRNQFEKKMSLEEQQIDMKKALQDKELKQK